MHILIFFLPCILFLVIGRPLAAVVCFFLQFTLIGWIPAAIWATVAVARHNSASRYYARRYYYAQPNYPYSRYPCR